MNKENNFKIARNLFIYLVVFIFFIIVPTLVNYFKNNESNANISLEKSQTFKYVYLNDRENYIIQNVDNSFLDDYYNDENTMVVFTASWCKYCVEEQNELNNFIINNPDKKVIIVSHDKTYEDLENYLKTNNFNWFVIFDKDKTIRNHIDPGSNGIPSTYLLNKSGKMIGFSIGTKNENEFLQFYNNEINIYDKNRPAIYE